METWTITFSESVENHIGMEIIGNRSTEGFLNSELLISKEKCESTGYKTELINLYSFLPEELKGLVKEKEVYVLVVRNGIEMLLKKERRLEKFYKEVTDTKNIVDKKAFMRGKVKNKLVRYNLCYADISQQPDYENKKGTIIDFKDVKYLEKIRKNMPLFFGEKSKNMFAELNYYYDISKCGIGPHGDSERRKVIALRIGEPLKIHYHWYYKHSPVGEEIQIPLDGGDIYIMSDKAVGYDWKRSIIPTLRHSTGCKKYTVFK